MDPTLSFSSTTIHMISFPSLFFNNHSETFKYSQDNYDNDIRSLNIYRCKCPVCGSVGFFHFHAKYERYLSDSDSVIVVKRIMCEACHTTHALLPDVIIPNRYFSSPFIMRLFSLYLKDRLSLSQLSCALHISIQCACSLVSFFEKHHHQLFNIISSCLNISFDQSFNNEYFSLFHLFFMQSPHHKKRHAFYISSVT